MPRTSRLTRTKLTAIVVAAALVVVLGTYLIAANHSDTTPSARNARVLPGVSMCGEPPKTKPSAIYTCKQPCSEDFSNVKWTSWTHSTATGWSGEHILFEANSACTANIVVASGNFPIRLSEPKKVSFCNLSGVGATTAVVFTRAVVDGQRLNTPVPVVMDCVHVG